MLKQGQELSFLDRGSTRHNCNDFYKKLVALLVQGKRSQRPLGTEILGRFYPELKFEGYFSGANPLYISIDEHEWISFQEQRKTLEASLSFYH